MRRHHHDHRAGEAGRADVATLVLVALALLLLLGVRIFGDRVNEKSRCQGDAVVAIGGGSSGPCLATGPDLGNPPGDAPGGGGGGGGSGGDGSDGDGDGDGDGAGTGDDLEPGDGDDSGDGTGETGDSDNGGGGGGIIDPGAGGDPGATGDPGADGTSDPPGGGTGDGEGGGSGGGKDDPATNNEPGHVTDPSDEHAPVDRTEEGDGDDHDGHDKDHHDGHDKDHHDGHADGHHDGDGDDGGGGHGDTGGEETAMIEQNLGMCGISPTDAAAMTHDPEQLLARLHISPEMAQQLTGCIGITWGECPSEEQMEQIRRDYLMPVLSQPMHAFEHWDSSRTCMGQVNGEWIMLFVKDGELQVSFVPDPYMVDSYLCEAGDMAVCERIGQTPSGSHIGSSGP